MALKLHNYKPSTTTFPDGSTVTLYIKPKQIFSLMRRKIVEQSQSLGELSGANFNAFCCGSILELCEGWDLTTQEGEAKPFTSGNLWSIHPTRRALMCMDLLYHLGIIEQEAAA